VDVEDYSIDNYYEKCDPLIKESFSKEQTREIKRLLSMSMQISPELKVKKINFNIWFFKLYFVTLFYGPEKRTFNRRMSESTQAEMFMTILTTSLLILLKLILIGGVLWALYNAKSVAGLDFFEEGHLGDFF